MASATVNGASLVANFNSTTGGGEMGSSPTSGGEQGDEQLSNIYSVVTTTSAPNNVEDENLHQWTHDSDNNRKRALPSVIDDDENNPPSTLSNAMTRSSKKRRKQSNPVRLATSTSTIRSVDNMAMEDYIEHNDELAGTNTRVSSSVVNTDGFDTPTEEDEEVPGATEEADDALVVPTSASSQQLRAIANVIEEDENVALDDDDYDDGRVHRCPHCNVLFEVEDHLRQHIEEEHVQKILERQLQQQNQKNLIGGVTVDCKRNANSPFDLSTASSSSVSATFQRYDGRHSNSSSSDASLHEENKLFHQHHHSSHHSQHHQQQQSQSSAASLHSPKDLPAASIMALSAFGAAPFLIPVLPTSSGTLLTRGSAIPSNNSIQSGSGSSMGGTGNNSCPTLTRIFNPEAFCELCNKEFCNKYFLKTHKANKHGVYSLDTLTSASATIPTSTTTLSSSQTNSGLNFSPNNSCSSSNMNRHQRRSGGLGPTTPPPLTLDCVQTSPTNVREVRESQQLPTIPSMMGPTAVNFGMLSNKVLPVMNPEAFCDICQKEFCNKYFLKKHRQKIHGIQDPPSASTPTGGNSINPVSAANLVSAAAVANSISALVDSIAAAAATNTDIVNLHSGSTFGPNAQHHHPHHHPVPPADLFYEYSARDLSAKIAAATQSSSKHSIQNLMGVGSVKSVSTSNAGSPQNGNGATNSGVSTTNIANDGGNHYLPGVSGNGNGGNCSPSSETNRWVPGSITVAGHVFTPERLREMGVINVDAFCEICCKEFCNKYFLRTHKMNKHGVGVATSEFSIPSGNLLAKSPSHPQSGSNHQSQQSSQQQPLSLVVDKDGCQQDQDGGRKSINSPGSNHSGSSLGKSTAMAGSIVTPLDQPPSSSPVHIESTQEASGVTQDLICEVCSRPFSSTYLLKMHKFYFHNSSSLAAAALGVCDIPAIIEEQIAAAELMRRRCRSGGGSSSCKSGDEAPTLGNDTNRNGASAVPINDELQKLQTMIRELNTSPNATGSAKDCSEVRCSVCLKEMKNKYFLRAHMMNEHGELHNEEVDTQECFNIPLKSEPEDYVDGVTPSKLANDSATSTPGSVETSCDLCGKDFCSKYFLRAHQLTVHSQEIQIKQEINPLNLNQMMLPVIPERIKIENINVNTPSGGALNLAIANHQVSSMMATTAPSPMTPAQERSNVTGRNFCEICNKELCNKYFMKTHMLKMHGINVDDKIHGGGVNGATIGGVMCDICQKELCSKYFLKVHKQNTHGCYEETPPITKENYVAAAAAAAAVAAAAINNSQQQHIDAIQSQLSNDGYASDGVTTTTSSNGNRYFSHYTEVCPLCDRRFKSIKWLKTHVINDHADLAKDSGLAELLATESYLASTGEFSPPQLNNNNNIRIPSLHQRHPHPNLSPRDYLNESTISPNKGSSKSPNSFQAHSHHPQHHHHHQSASQSSSTTAADDCCDVSSATAATTTTTTSAASTAIFKADELGSTGAAIATATAGTSGGGGNGGCGVISGGGGSNDIRNKVSGLPMYSHQLLHHRPRGTAGIIRKPITTTTTGSGGATTRIYHCSYCTYSTRWLSNLYAHEKRHTGLSSEGEKRFSCRICHRAYRYNHSLQRHLVSHKTTGILFKHVINAANTNSNNLTNVFQCSVSGTSQLQQQSNISTTLKSHLNEIDAKSSPKPNTLMGNSHLQTAQIRHEFGNGLTSNDLSSNSKASKAPVRIKKYRCSKCGAKYRSREQCLEHIHQHHSSNARSHRRKNIVTSGNKAIFHCPGCEFSCSDKEVMTVHLSRHHNNQQPIDQESNIQDREFEDSNVHQQLQKQKFNNEFDDDVRLKLQQQMGIGQQHSQFPMTYAVPQAPPTAGSFIMQPFLITQQQQTTEAVSSVETPTSPTTTTTAFTVSTTARSVDGNGQGNGAGGGRELKSPNSSSIATFVPSLVYLPVSRKVNDSLTVTFNLIPA